MTTMPLPPWQVTRPPPAAPAEGRPAHAARPRLSLRWSVPVLRLVAIGLLAAGAAVIAWTILPLAWGWSSSVIVSGSMSPRVHRGDIVVSSPPAPDWRPAVGQVVTVPDPLHPGETVTHRVVGFDERGLLVTRGDANGSDDAFRTAPGQVRGIARLLVPRIGLATQLLREGHPTMFVAQGAVVLAVLALALRLPAAPSRPAARGRHAA
ncbi:S26 family signal peptidase [Actinoplanes sp. NPDC026623]|uniref:S26 family signal peptidase n=1 Tax=Actinoplanes sp. NPDC026623 TaxID=3155610 RepID=UPI0033E37986